MQIMVNLSMIINIFCYYFLYYYLSESSDKCLECDETQMVELDQFSY